MRKASVVAGTLALFAVMASAPSARAEETNEADWKPVTEGRSALNVTGSALVVGGGLALLPAAYVASTVAVGAVRDGGDGAERAAKDFQEPVVFAPLAAGFCALMIGAALLVVVNPPTSTPDPKARAKKSAFTNPFAFTF